MVYFECQKCNESLKKPKVAKHLQMCGSWYVSCIDCSMVFTWETFESHTACMSEAQKYQGKLYEAKENTNKGQVKQDNWISNVENVIEDPNSKVPAHIKASLQKLLGFSNIPRKQKPFTNFVKNSLNMWHDEKKIAELWNIISAANAKKPEEPKPTAVMACLPCPPAAEKWTWKRALDEELKSAGGELPWKRLRDAVVAKAREAGEVNGAPAEKLRDTALAAIPDAYLSKTDEFVRLPSA